MNKLSALLLKTELETPAVLKAANRAESKLGELKGTMGIIPNKAILLHTLPLQEAKTSSEIEKYCLHPRQTITLMHTAVFDNNYPNLYRKVRFPIKVITNTYIKAPFSIYITEQFERWWDKYRLSLHEIDTQVRDSEDVMWGYLKELGYE